MKVVDEAVTETVLTNTATITFEFDQVEIGNSLCVSLVNLGANPMTCSQVRKYPKDLSGDYALDLAEATLIGTLTANGTPTDRAIIQEVTAAYKAVSYVFTGATKGDQIRGTCSIGAPR